MSALDPEKLVAPKAYWFDSAALDEWYESRKQVGQTEILDGNET
ncbi:hypothetical protein ANRL3_02492 [Anaerolineae bacterium]|nr:hypothetical protein ANRL3_02492 [Anaerolineae bacterium]